MVTVHDCFTTRVFGDSSLIFVTDYHPLSKTLAEQLGSSSNFTSQRTSNRSAPGAVPEQVIWGYVVQLVSALKVIHENGLAARLISPSKILVTGKNRIRLNSCAVPDVVDSGCTTPLEQLQREDLRQLGRLALTLAANSPNVASTSAPRAIESATKPYSERLRTVITALIFDTWKESSLARDITVLSNSIADQILPALDASLLAEDDLTWQLGRELENGRLVRLMAKLGCINERPELNPGFSPQNPSSSNPSSNAWSETGERYYLKLFRDYVFHQVAAEDGRPVMDLAHIIGTLNKLDAGSEERIMLMTRDEQNVFVVSFREVKKGLEAAFAELMRMSERGVGHSPSGSGGFGGMGVNMGGIGWRNV